MTINIFTVFSLLLTIISFSGTNISYSSTFDHNTPTVYMTPHQGEQAFSRIRQSVIDANEFVYMTLYSWSDKGLFLALKKTLEKSNPPKVKIVLHRPLYKTKKGPSATLSKRVTILEKLGAEFKVSKKKMHEKFLIVDNHILMNGSANMSSGPLSRYSENIIFYTNYLFSKTPYQHLINQFKHEFSILFNSAEDIITHEEEVSKELIEYLQYDQLGSIKNQIYHNLDLFLVSSSMNFNPIKISSDTLNYQNGQYLKLVPKRNGKNKTWTVRNKIIKEINNAKKSILLCLNHLTLPKIKDAVINATKRGVEVKWIVDNNEYKYLSSKKNGRKFNEQTVYFVKEFKELYPNKILPVRVKWYSLSPTPRFSLLNHHKFILIDFDTDYPTLLSGSSNMSKTAEHSQFDNTVVHKGLQYHTLYRDFKNEFDHLWMLGRNSNDLPKKEIINKYKKLYNSTYLLVHKKTPISLKWDEVTKLRSELYKVAPGLKKRLIRNKSCLYYHIFNKKFYSYNKKRNDYKKCGQ